MDLPPITQMLVNETASVIEAIRLIDANAQGIVFVVKNQGTLAGVATDGDIRRFLLTGLPLSMPVAEAMNRDCLWRPMGTSHEELAELLSARIRHIPLLDETGRPIDYACSHRFTQVPILEPSLSGNELRYLTECIRTNWVSRGSFIKRFEAQFVEHVGLPYALAVCNGTAALHLALLSLGVGPGDEVVVPDLTFAACANAVVHAGAVPVLADIERDTWGLDPRAVERVLTPKTKVIMAVHLYGHPCKVDALAAIAADAGVFLLEDCAEALGARARGRPVGSFGAAATFSFFGNKTITTGEGGMVVFRDEECFMRAKVLRDHGMDPHRRYWHEQVGYNYRMTNLQAALGVAQMERLGSLLERKRDIDSTYRKRLAGLASAELPPRQPWADPSCWLWTFLLPEDLAIERQSIIEKLLRNGIETRPAFHPLHTMPPFEGLGSPDLLPESRTVGLRGFSLPSSVSLKDSEQERICRVLLSIIQTRTMTRERLGLRSVVGQT